MTPKPFQAPEMVSEMAAGRTAGTAFPPYARFRFPSLAFLSPQDGVKAVTGGQFIKSRPQIYILKLFVSRRQRVFLPSEYYEIHIQQRAMRRTCRGWQARSMRRSCRDRPALKPQVACRNTRRRAAARGSCSPVPDAASLSPARAHAMLHLSLIHI